jgi:tRNA G18 (ribose-2'-O)-methylase SpoU
MKKNGYYGIGVLNPKSSENWGTLYRTAQILDADFIFIIGARFKIQASDTMNSSKHIPLFEYKDFTDFNDHRPFGCKLIGIEITDKAIPIHKFIHPKQGCYLLGAEDYGLTEQAIEQCQEIVFLEGERSMNVSVAGSIVLYDRHVKLNCR